MTNTPHPDRTSEAHEVRELLADNSSAQLALDSLAREESSETIPPVPEDLREQWKDRYGEARREVPASKPLPWWKNLSALTKLGASTAFAAFAIFLGFQSVSKNPGSASPEGANPTPPLMRDQGTFEATPSTLTFFIPSAKFTIDEMVELRGQGLLFQADDIDDAITKIEARDLQSAVILDAASTNLLTYPDRTTIPLFGDSMEDPDIYDLAEALDDFLSR